VTEDEPNAERGKRRQGIAMAASTIRKANESHRSRPQDTDRHVGAKLRERRLMLGMSQQQMADLIGVTYQQAHKYEKGINRIASGRLYAIAQGLGVEMSYFYEGIGGAPDAFEPTPKQRLLLELTRNFANIASRRQQEAICNLARTLASLDQHEALAPAEPGMAMVGEYTADS
jgi:transcriptional regulator with XRE-family HTH domain